MKRHFIYLTTLLLFLTVFSCQREVKEGNTPELLKRFLPILISNEDKALRDSCLNLIVNDNTEHLESRSLSTLYLPITVEIYSVCVCCYRGNCSDAYIYDRDWNYLGNLNCVGNKITLYNLPITNGMYSLHIGVANDTNTAMLKLSSSSYGPQYFRINAGQTANIELLQPGYIVQGSSTILSCY